MAGDLFAWTVGDAALGDDLLELGPGPGVTTARLASVARRVTTIDIDEPEGRKAPGPGVNVRQVRGDAARLPFAAGQFSAVAAFAMLHHVGSSALQRQLMGEARRVLRPGGVFVGCDVRPTLTMRLVHLGGTFEPVPFSRLIDELRAAGFGRVTLAERPIYISWRASRPD